MKIRKGIAFFSTFGILSRMVFASKDFTHMDAVLYAIGTFDYSVKNNTPPFPGYFLYIMSAKMLNLFTHNPHTSLMALSIFYSGLIAGLLYYFGNILKGRAAGISSAVLFLTSPLFWHKGISIYGYLNSGFFIVLTALLGYKIILEKKDNLIFWFSVSFAALIGIRPQESVVMAPFYLFVLFHTKIRKALLSLAVFTAFCLLWAAPLVLMSGGLKEYSMASRMSGLYVLEDSVFSGYALTKVANHAARMALSFQWAYFLGAIPLCYFFARLFRSKNLFQNKKAQFFAAWLLPVISFNLFIQFGEIGHGMGWGLGFLLLIGYGIVLLCEDCQRLLNKPKWKPALYAGIFSPIVLFNAYMFLHDFDGDKPDFYDFRRYRPFNYADVRKHNDFLSSRINFISSRFSQKGLLIISSAVFSHQVMFHLPEAIVIQPNMIHKRNNPNFYLYNRYKNYCFQNKIDYIIPDGVNRLVIFDDIFIPYFKSIKDSESFRLPGQYTLLACAVFPGQKLKFDYRSILIE